MEASPRTRRASSTTSATSRPTPPRACSKALRSAQAGGVLWMNGDVVFDPAVLDRLAALPRRGPRSSSRQHRDVRARRRSSTRSTTTASSRELSKQVTDALGEAVGINFVAAQGQGGARSSTSTACDEQDYFERGIETGDRRGRVCRLRPVDISDLFAVEVDFAEDLERAIEARQEYRRTHPDAALNSARLPGAVRRGGAALRRADRGGGAAGVPRGFTLRDPRIDEASGLAIGVESPGMAYRAERQRRHQPVLRRQRSDTGRDGATITVRGAPTSTGRISRSAPSPAGVSSVWLADIGDNDAVRDEVDVYRVPSHRSARRRTTSRSAPGGPPSGGCVTPAARSMPSRSR